MTAKGQRLGRLRAAGFRPFRIGGAFGAAVLPVARHCSEVNVSGGLVGDCVEFTALMALAARVKLSLWTRDLHARPDQQGTGDFTAGEIQAVVRSPPTDGWGDGGLRLIGVRRHNPTLAEELDRLRWDCGQRLRREVRFDTMSNRPL